MLTRTSAPRRAVPPWRRRVGLLRQDPALFPHLSVRQNLTYAPGAAAPRRRGRPDRGPARHQRAARRPAGPAVRRAGAPGRARPAAAGALRRAAPRRAVHRPGRRAPPRPHRAGPRPGRGAPGACRPGGARAGRRAGVRRPARRAGPGPDPAGRLAAEVVSGRPAAGSRNWSATGASCRSGRAGPGTGTVAGVHPERVAAGAQPDRGLVLTGQVRPAARPGRAGRPPSTVGGTVLTVRLPDRPRRAPAGDRPDGERASADGHPARPPLLRPGRRPADPRR